MRIHENEELFKKERRGHMNDKKKKLKTVPSTSVGLFPINCQFIYIRFYVEILRKNLHMSCEQWTVVSLILLSKTGHVDWTVACSWKYSKSLQQLNVSQYFHLVFKHCYSLLWPKAFGVFVCCLTFFSFFFFGFYKLSYAVMCSQVSVCKSWM